MPLRSLVAGAFRGAPAWAAIGVLERLGRAPAGTFAVLTYHRVDEAAHRPWLYPGLLSATPQRFDDQIRAITDRYHPITLPELLAAHRGGATLPERAVLVTFDDAYADFRDVAWPILRRRGVVPTLFVPTARAAGPPEPFWWDRVWNAVRTTREPLIDGPAGRRFELGDEAGRRAAARAVIDHLKGLDHDAAMRAAEELAARLGGASGGQPGEPASLDWEALRSLAAEGVDIAPHSRTHPVLTRVGMERLVEELAGSRDDVARELGGAGHPSVFAYPAGRHDDRTRAALAALGFELGFTTDRGSNVLARSDPLRLRRVNVGFRAGPELLRAQLAVFGIDTSRYRAGAV